MITADIAVAIMDGFSLKKSIQELKRGQILDVPTGNYGLQDCGNIVLADNVVIRNSDGTAILSCRGKDRHFIIRGRNVTLTGFVLTDGATSQDGCSENNTACLAEMDGGCVKIVGNNAMVKDCSFSDCVAARNGGAISLTGSDIYARMEGVNVSFSKAMNGAGIFSYGGLTLERCAFRNNLAENDGGAIVLYGSSASLRAKDSMFISNTALAGHGGAIAAELFQAGIGIPCLEATQLQLNISLELLASTVSNNTAGGKGGGIYGQHAVAVVIHGEPAQALFANNTASQGGALDLSGGAISVSGKVFFSRNEAVDEGDGGAIHMRCGCQGNLSGDVVFVGNVASPSNWGYGGAIFASVVSLQVAGDVAFESNQAVSGCGGAIYSQYSVVDLAGRARFAENAGYWGGAACLSNNPICRLSEGVLVTVNQAPYGGAIYAVGNDDFEIAGGAAFALNQALVGGAMMLTGRGRTRIGGRAVFSNNSAEVGGALTLVELAEQVRANANACDGFVRYLIGPLIYWGAALSSFKSFKLVSNRLALAGARLGRRTLSGECGVPAGRSHRRAGFGTVPLRPLRLGVQLRGGRGGALRQVFMPPVLLSDGPEFIDAAVCAVVTMC